MPLLIGIATAFGISSSIQSYLLSAAAGEPIAGMATHLLILNLVYWYVPALLAPAIMRVATRYQFGRGLLWKPLAVHVVGALSYSVLHSMAMLGTRVLLMQQNRPSRGWWFAARVSGEAVSAPYPRLVRPGGIRAHRHAQRIA